MTADGSVADLCELIGAKLGDASVSAARLSRDPAGREPLGHGELKEVGLEHGSMIYLQEEEPTPVVEEEPTPPPVPTPPPAPSPVVDAEFEEALAVARAADEAEQPRAPDNTVRDQLIGGPRPLFDDFDDFSMVRELAGVDSPVVDVLGPPRRRRHREAKSFGGDDDDDAALQAALLMSAAQPDAAPLQERPPNDHDDQALARALAMSMEGEPDDDDDDVALQQALFDAEAQARKDATLEAAELADLDQALRLSAAMEPPPDGDEAPPCRTSSTPRRRASSTSHRRRRPRGANPP